MKIETQQQQQQQTGWAMDGRTTPRSAVMDTFRWDAGEGSWGTSLYEMKQNNQDRIK